MGFATGFKTGYEAVSDTIREYERQKLKEGLRKLGPEAVSTAGNKYEILDKEGKVVGTGLVTPEMLGSAQGRGTSGLEAIEQAYATKFNPETGAYDPTYMTVRQLGPSYAARAGGKDIGMYETEAAARGASEPYNIGLTRQAAGLYEQAGLDAEARQMRGQARQAETAMSQLAMDKERLGFAAAEAKRAEEMQPLNIRKAEQTLKLGEQTLDINAIDMATKGFDLKDKQRTQELTKWISQNPNAPIKDIIGEATSLGLSQKSIGELVKQTIGIDEDMIKNSKLQIQKIIEGKSTDQILKEFQYNDLISPGTHYEKVVDKKGNVSLFLVDSNDNKRLSKTPDFTGSAGEVDSYLRSAAVSLPTALDFAMNLEKAKTDITAKKASTVKDLAYADAAGQRGLGGGRDKTPFAVKSQIDNAERTLELTNKALAEQPNNRDLQQRATMQKFELANMYRSQGIEIDPYKFAGVPSPKSAISASDIKTLSEAELGARVEASRRMFGDQYADEFSSYVQANRPAAKGEKGGLEKPSAKAEAAAPTEDTKKYIRSKNPRGGYLYEESPRGLTKKQYAEIDVGKK